MRTGKSPLHPSTPAPTVPAVAPDAPGPATGWVTVEADPTLVRIFRESSGDSGNPRWLPATYLAAFRIDKDELGIPSDSDAKLNASNHYEWFDRVEPGEQLEHSSRLVDVTEKQGRTGRLVFYTWETSFRRPGADHLVARSRNTTIRRYDREEK